MLPWVSRSSWRAACLSPGAAFSSKPASSPSAVQAREGAGCFLLLLVPGRAGTAAELAAKERPRLKQRWTGAGGLWAGRKRGPRSCARRMLRLLESSSGVSGDELGEGSGDEVTGLLGSLVAGGVAGSAGGDGARRSGPRQREGKRTPLACVHGFLSLPPGWRPAEHFCTWAGHCLTLQSLQGGLCAHGAAPAPSLGVSRT